MIKDLISRFNFQNKVLACAGCGKALRVPVRSGKTLRVVCPQCKYQFDVRFSNPVKELLNVRSYQQLVSQFKALPTRAKIAVILLIVSGIMLISSIIGKLTNSNSVETKPGSANELKI